MVVKNCQKGMIVVTRAENKVETMAKNCVLAR